MAKARKILTRQVGLRLTPDDDKRIRAVQRRDEQLSDAVRRLVRVGLVAAETSLNNDLNSKPFPHN